MSINVDPNAAHAVYAPSSAHRWIPCTASATAIAALGEQEEGDEAKEGTAAHEEIERILGHLNGKVADSLEIGAITVNAEHPAAYGISLMVAYLRGLLAGKLWIEQRVALTSQIWGRLDCGHWHQESATVTIVDYKNGFVGVDAEENEQLRIYGAALISQYKLAAKWIRYVVVQPRDFRPVPRVKQWIESADSLFEFASKTAAIPTGPLTFVAGQQCTYCPLFGRCEASRDVLTKLGVMMAAPADAVPAAQWAIFKACEKPIKDWFASGDKAHLKKALTGAVPAGMKLVTALKHKAWKDEVAARALVVSRLGVDALDVPTPAQAIERGIPEAEVNAMAPRPDGGPALVFESDKRPAWAAKSVEAMFGSVTVVRS